MSLRHEAADPGRAASLAAAAFHAAIRELGAVFLRVATAMERRRRIHRTTRIVSRLDDHMLKDIGLQRGAIPGAARELVERQDGPRG